MSTFTIRVQELHSPETIHVLDVRWFTSIKDIKDMLHRITKCPPRTLDLFYGTSASRLSNHMTLHDFGIEMDGHCLRLAINNERNGGPTSNKNGMPMINAVRDVELNDDCAEMLSQVSQALSMNRAPMKTDVLDCTGGVYFMRDSSGNKVAVFKPHDEEQGMPNNGKGYDGNGETAMRPNFKPGQGFLREVAAYIMDVDNFSGVPATTLVHCEHEAFLYQDPTINHHHAARKPTMYPKLGSLQKFIHCDTTFEDIGTGLMSDFEVQKIALLDMRLLNCDRNAGNILVAPKLNFGLSSPFAYRSRSNTNASNGSAGNPYSSGGDRDRSDTLFSAASGNISKNQPRSASTGSWDLFDTNEEAEKTALASALLSGGDTVQSGDQDPLENSTDSLSGVVFSPNFNPISPKDSTPASNNSQPQSRRASDVSIFSATDRSSPFYSPARPSSGYGYDTEDTTRPKKEEKDRYLLIPIDHGYALPTGLDIKEWDWCWFHLPQCKKPVHPLIKQHLFNIDFDDLCSKLEKQVAPSEDSLFLLRLVHNLLVQGVTEGLTLYDIACIIARLDEEDPSPLERTISVAEENAHRALEMRSTRLNSRGSSDSSSSNPQSRRASDAGRNTGNSIKTMEMVSVHEGSPARISPPTMKVIKSSESIYEEKDNLSCYKHNRSHSYTSSGEKDRRNSLHNDIALSPPTLPQKLSGQTDGSGSSVESMRNALPTITDHTTSSSCSNSSNSSSNNSNSNSTDNMGLLGVSLETNHTKSKVIHTAMKAPRSPQTSSPSDHNPTKNKNNNNMKEKSSPDEIDDYVRRIGGMYGIGVGASDGAYGPRGGLVRMESVRISGKSNPFPAIVTKMPSPKGFPSKHHRKKSNSKEKLVVNTSTHVNGLGLTNPGEVGSEGSPFHGNWADTAVLSPSSSMNGKKASGGMSLLEGGSGGGSGGGGLTRQSTVGLYRLSPPISPAKANVNSKSSPVLPRRGGSSANLLKSKSSSDIPEDGDIDTDVEEHSPKTIKKYTSTGGNDNDNTSDEDDFCDIEATDYTDSAISSENDGQVKGDSYIVAQPRVPPKLMRVSSFTAFASTPLYDLEGGNERRLVKLVREKRREHLGTHEYKRLRAKFASDRMKVLLSQKSAQKLAAEFAT